MPGPQDVSELWNTYLTCGVLGLSPNTARENKKRAEKEKEGQVRCCPSVIPASGASGRKIAEKSGLHAKTLSYLNKHRRRKQNEK